MMNSNGRDILPPLTMPGRRRAMKNTGDCGAVVRNGPPGGCLHYIAAGRYFATTIIRPDDRKMVAGSRIACRTPTPNL